MSHHQTRPPLAIHSSLASLVVLFAACSPAPGQSVGSPGATGGAPATSGGSTSAGTTGGAAPTTGGTATGGSALATGGVNSSGGAGFSTGGTSAGTGGSAGSGTVAGTAGALGTGGSGGNAGQTGGVGSSAGGNSNTGGTAGAGGTAGTGGSAGAAGGGALGPELTDVTKLTAVTCAITPTVTPATDMPLVGVATFSTDLAGADRAIIQFGKTSTYTLQAPVNWGASMHRTLVLGMPANTEVHYRVVAMQGNSACVGPDATFRTGANISGAPGNVTPTKGTSSEAPAPGFIVADNGNFAYIVNQQGEVVWAHRFPIMLSRALMSWDGNYMYGRDTGPFNAASGGTIYRVAMDGSGESKLNVSGGHHHDLVVTPSGIAYPGKQAAGACDCIFTANADGSNSKCLVDLDVVFGKFKIGAGAQAMEKCHVNAIRYYKDVDAFSVSDREKDVIAFISSAGAVLGSVGATPTGTTPNHAKAEGADSQTNSVWRVQHGHDWYEPNKLVLWSNGNFSGGSSKLLHYTINGASAKLDWQYSGAGNSPTFSDALHLPNGHFLATNSQSGAVHEIDATQKLVQSFNNLNKGYSTFRPTLYGPPAGR